MGRLREIPRTAAFAWSSDISSPSIATGTRAGAVDADFSGESKLEIWDLDLGNRQQDVDVQPIASLGTDTRFYDIAWSPPTTDHPEGIIAGALENGSLDLWDAAKLKTTPKEALVSRSTKHSGAIKALQFNPHRPELLASSGAKGELYITNLNNVENPYRLGTAAARADDIDALDWNKKVPHIMATAGSGGFVTVWDVKDRKERLTLNNYGRKAVSAVAWDPDLPTKLATAVSSDQDPLILLWDLRNSSAPERILRGHEQGILSLSWCAHDTELLLSCGKDNRNICWNPHTGEAIGEFPIVTNWTFQTRWNPRHPTLLGTASFDGKIVVQSTQSTNAPSSKTSATGATAADAADFFASAEIQPLSSSFSLPKPPKWLKRPVGASFGFGGKLVKFSTKDDQPTKSTVEISTLVSDSGVASSISSFQTAMNTNEFTQLCESKAAEAKADSNKNDWKIIQTLFSDTPRKGLLSYLGFSDFHLHNENPTQAEDEQENNTIRSPTTQVNGVKDNSYKRLSAFFDNTGTGNQDFLADLAASKGGRTNNPFEIYMGSESETDKEITRAIILGSFEEAMDICLKENRMSEAFMIAICGGQKCIDKAQAAYFAQSSNGPNYLRLLASVVGKNLWDVVYNANLDHWADVMATLCTYADETEFPDLCEALGDRVEEFSPDRKDATFCYLAGSKLEKLVPIWIREMQDVESSRSDSASDESAFSIHVEALQNLIEKVSIFRKATRYEDNDVQDNKTSQWRLESLYSLYAEYADVVAAYGHLDLAEEYLGLLPAHYPAADVARNRIRQATKKGTAQARAMPTTSTLPRAQPAYGLGAGLPGSVAPTISAPSQSAIPSRPGPGGHQSNSYAAVSSPYAPMTASAPYAPAVASTPYAPAASTTYAPAAVAPYAAGPTPFTPAVAPSAYAPATPFAYQPPVTNIVPSEPNQARPPPPKAINGSVWNDLPENFSGKPPTSRRNTPGPGASAIRSPFVNQPENAPPQAIGRMQTPLPPPPKVGSPRPSVAAQGAPPPPTVTTTAPNPYAPPASAQTLPPPQPLIPRVSSPYNPPPSTAAATASPFNRYAPAPGAVSTPAPGTGPPPGGRVIAPNPYAQPPSAQSASMPRPPQPQNFTQAPPPRAPPSAAMAPPPSRGFPTQPPPQTQAMQSTGPPSAAGPPAAGPPPMAGPPRTQLSAAPGETTLAPAAPHYPAGDRSHIPAEAISIYETLNNELQRIKGLAPANFKQHVDDTEKRMNLLFDALNNQSLTAEVVTRLKDFTAAFSVRNFDLALEVHTELLKIVEQSPPWAVGLKRFISMSRATPV